MMNTKTRNSKKHLRKLRQRVCHGNSPRPHGRSASIRFTPMRRILEPGSIGNAEIEHFMMTPLESLIHNNSEAALIKRKIKEDCPHAPFKYCPPGRYTRLLIDGETMMSDTPMEMETNQHVLEKAHGNVLIGGLGLGMLIIPLLAKPEVHKLVIVEQNPNVIELVGRQMPASPKIEIVNGDIFRWVPGRSTKFNIIYFDIWQWIGPEFLDDIEILKNRFEPYLDASDPQAWMGAWLEDYYRWMVSLMQNQDLNGGRVPTKRFAVSYKEHPPRLMDLA